MSDPPHEGLIGAIGRLVASLFGLAGNSTAESRSLRDEIEQQRIAEKTKPEDPHKR